MTKLEEIEKKSSYADSSDLKWLINRVKKLEAALNQIYIRCQQYPKCNTSAEEIALKALKEDDN